jgi:hypothetical protein
VHLVRDAYGLYVVAGGTGLGHDFLEGQLGIVPPHLWVLFGPSGLHGLDGSLVFRIKCGGSHRAIVDVDERGFHGAGADVKA